MPTTYAYKVRDRSGKIVQGTVDADSETAVVGRLRQMGLAPLLIEEYKGASLGKKELHLPWGHAVKPKDIAVMSRQFATMINSGLSLLRALNILAEQTDNSRFREVLSTVRTDVEKGQSLSQALAKHPKVFSRLYVAMIKAGETGGVLDKTLLRMAETMEKEVALRHKIKSAMTYPVVVFGLVIIIVTAMLLFVVPMFKNLYTQLGGTLPLPTRVLIVVSDAVKHLWFIWMPATIGGIVGFKKWIKTDAGRAKWDAVKLKLPVFGVLVHKTALSRYSRTLAALFRSGVPILQGLDIVKETVNNA
ncbi:MAG: type II secretion system F family protein, partial [Actinomycetota bacterium]